MNNLNQWFETFKEITENQAQTYTTGKNEGTKTAINIIEQELKNKWWQEDHTPDFIEGYRTALQDILSRLKSKI